MGRALDTYSKNLPFEQAAQFRNLVIRNIEMQKYAGGYKPYHEEYAKNKLRKVGHLRFWILTGDMLGSILMVKTDRGWVVRFGGSLHSMKAHILEFGGVYAGRLHPARPVFGPTRTEFRLGVMKKSLKKVANRIRSIWRAK